MRTDQKTLDSDQLDMSRPSPSQTETILFVSNTLQIEHS